MIVAGKTLKIAGQVLLAAWAIAVLVPLALAVLASLKTNTEIFANPFGIDLANLRWENYVSAWNGPPGGGPLWQYVMNSVIATSCTLLIGVTLSTFAAYGLARAGGRVGMLVTRLFTFILTIPLLAILVPIFFIAGSLGLRNSAWGISVIYAAFVVPLATLLLRPFFASIPIELSEAAQLDGAGQIRTFFAVYLPLAWPAILSVFIIELIGFWSEFGIALVLLTERESKTLPVGLLAFKGEFFTDLGVQFAGLLLAAAPLVVIYFFFSKRIMAGLSASGMLK
ncbi:carbohydrate ABC transporter permease [Pseudarthrobacter sp. 1C304]|uniref:carbohydrate ABC transporter permease n=1 Tax=Pseudarthrobacter sp. 1C304 TaxID=3457438 RepID=UPI003FD42603